MKKLVIIVTAFICIASLTGKSLLELIERKNVTMGNIIAEEVQKSSSTTGETIDIYHAYYPFLHNIVVGAAAPLAACFFLMTFKEKHRNKKFIVPLRLIAGSSVPITFLNEKGSPKGYFCMLVGAIPSLLIILKSFE
jgi:hypothetical protein